MRWFIADTHFNHRNIIKYDERPFNHLNQMERVLVEKWNAKVKEGDTVYHLGDFALGDCRSKTHLLTRLKGKKILIRGNHDGTATHCEKIGWDFVCDGLLVHICGCPVLLVHDPSVFPCSQFVAHGHTHQLSSDCNRLCVSCNLWDYTPISESELLRQLMKGKT